MFRAARLGSTPTQAGWYWCIPRVLLRMVYCVWTVPFLDVPRATCHRLETYSGSGCFCMMIFGGGLDARLKERDRQPKKTLFLSSI